MFRPILTRIVLILSIGLIVFSCQKTPVQLNSKRPETFRKYDAPYGIVWEELLKVLEFDLQYRISAEDFHAGYVSTSWKKVFIKGTERYKHRINAIVKVSPDGKTLVTVNRETQVPIAVNDKRKKKTYKSTPSDGSSEKKVLLLLQRRLRQATSP